MPKTYVRQRVEPRLPLELPVKISGHPDLPGVETAFTCDVSSRGACVVSVRRWEPDDHLIITSLPGDFHALARVAYCNSKRGGTFRIGVEFLEPNGQWVVPPEENLATPY